MPVDVSVLVTENLDIWSSTIKAKNSQGRGSSKKTELYGVKKLRELILELAVRGLLVPQDPSDKPVSVLLEKIEAEKKRLIKEGKLKKQSNQRPISEEDKPFDIPKSWVYRRFGEVMFNRDGERKPVSASERKSMQGKYDYYGASGVIDKVNDYLFDKPLLLIGEDGANLISRSTPIAFIAQGKYWVNNHAHVLDGLSLNFLEFIALHINAISLEPYVTGTAQPKMNQAKMNSIVLAIPPETEQHRIVTKVNELMTLCDRLEQQQESSISAHQTLVETLLGTLVNAADATSFSAAWQRIAENFDVLFSTEHSIEQLKQIILQLAVMGKLVPQDPNDEPASVLLEKITKEKEQLVKEKKIKKQKPLPPITEEEKPFELPAGWEWCRLEDIVEIYSGITKGRNLTGRKLISVPYLSVANVQRSRLDLNAVKEIAIPIEEKERYQVINGDLLITEGGDWDKVGRTAIWRNEMDYVAHQNHVFKARVFLPSQSEVWLEKYLNSQFSRDYFSGSSKQTTNLASINKTQLRGCLIALPPPNEKELIVKAVEQLVSLCDAMLERIKAAQTTQLNLTDAIAKQATA